MSTTATATSSGIGLGGLAFLVLFVMKLTGHTDMNWLLVLTSMVWLPILCVLAVLTVIGIGLGLLFGAAWAADKVSGR